MRVLKGLALAAAAVALLASEARATIVVDAFTVSQITQQVGVGHNSTTATGTGILGGTRTQTVSLDTQPPFSVGVASSGSGVFSGSFTGGNSPVGGSYFDLGYTTTATDAATGNTGFYFTASSQGGSVLTITANGSSTASVIVPAAPGFSNYFVSFGSFSNSSVFSALTSLDIRATFPNVTGSGPSITFSGPIIISAIPEPSIMALGSVAVVALGALRLRRKSS